MARLKRSRNSLLVVVNFKLKLSDFRTPEKMLLDALVETGASMRNQGTYPISEELKAWLLQPL